MIRASAKIGALVLLASAIGCRRAPVTAPPSPPPTAPVLTPLAAGEIPAFRDVEDRASMVLALDRTLSWLDKQPTDKTWEIGGLTVTHDRLQRSLVRFREIWEAHADQADALRAAITRDFELYRFTWGDHDAVLITGYHAPVYAGSFQESEVYRYPLYARPDDLVAIRPSLFPQKFLEPGDALRGDRVMGRLEGKKVVPYYTREEIDEHGALAGRGLELVYLADYFDQFAFHVQGGGFVALAEGGYLKLSYAGKNGQPYTSIGRMLVDEGIFTEDTVSMQAIETYFGEKPSEVKRVCYANASYVFYSTDGVVIDALGPEHFPPGVLGFPVTARRSIATDKRFFPGGMLAYIEGVQRRLEDSDPAPFGAFVIDHDTGGAIKRNHIDFFQGAGEQAEHDAGLLKDESGTVTFLLIKE